MEKNNKSYRPSSGTEGMWFEEKFCMNCLHCNPDPDGKKQCDIMFNAFFYETNEEKYPKEWIYDENDQPTCTAWIRWDWDNDGDPDDPDNPKAPVPDDPNQLCLPFEMNFIQPELIKQKA